MNVLVLETSTSAAKAMVYSSQQGVLRTVVNPYSPLISTVETHDAVEVFKLLISTGREAASGFDIAAIALVGTWHSTVLCQDNLPVTPVYTWAHLGASRIAGKSRNDPIRFKNIYSKTGCIPHASFPIYRLIYLKEQGLNVHVCDIYGFGELVFTQMTGVRATSRNMASGTGLMNIHSLDWDDELLEISEIQRHQLPPIYDHSFSSPLRPNIAMQLGVQANIPVTLPFADGCMNQIGAGALKPGNMTMSIGTSCAIRTTTIRPMTDDPNSGLWCYYAVENWLTGAATTGGTSCINWFQSTFAKGMTLKELDQSTTSASTELPIFLPFIAGERSPGWNSDRHGGFVSIRSTDTLGSMYRSVLEGVLFNVFQCYEQLVNRTPIHAINMSGGILYSTIWKQMAADIWQVDLHVPDTEQASLLGGAYMGLFVLGELADLTEVDKSKTKAISPNPDMQSYYRQNYLRYLDAYGRF